MGLCAVGICQLTSNPFTVLKTHHEAIGEKNFAFVEGISEIVKKEGFKAYKGLFTSLLRDMPYAGIQVSFYSYFKGALKPMLGEAEKSKENVIVAGALSYLAQCLPLILLKICESD